MANLPELPESTAHLWKWYCDLDAKRQAGFSINALSWSDIRAYFELRRIVPESWEIDAICQLDDAFLMSRLDKTAGKIKGAKALKLKANGSS